MRLLAAFVWLHWKQQWNAISGRSSASSRFAAASQVGVRVILVLLFAGLAAAGAAAAWVGGEALLAGPDRRAPVLAVLRILTGFVTLLALLLPLLRAGFGALPGTERFLLLPISRRGLHAVESATYLTDPWLLLFLPALVVVAVPTSLSDPGAGLTMVLAALAFLGTLGILAAALTFAVRLVLRDRRRAEAAALVLFLGLMALSLLPALVEDRRREAPPESKAATAPIAPEAGPSEPANGFEGSDRFPWLLQMLPSEAYSRVASEASAGRPLRGSASFLPLGVMAAAAWVLSGALWRRLVGSPETGSRRRVERALPGWRTVPGCSPATLAIAGAVVRGTLRTVQGKIVAVMPTLMVAVFSVLGEAESGPWGRLFGGPSLVLAAAFLAITGLQNVLLNLFGVDGGGLTLQLLLPVGPRQLVRGKALGGALLLAVILLPALLAALLLGEGISPVLGLAGFLTSLGTYLLFFPAAAGLSLLFPKASNLAKMGQEGKPHPASALIGFVGLLFLLVPGGLAGFVGLTLGGPWGALAAEASFVLLAGLLFLVFSRSVAAAFELRRDAIYLAIRGS